MRLINNKPISLFKEVKLKLSFTNRFVNNVSNIEI